MALSALHLQTKEHLSGFGSSVDPFFRRLFVGIHVADEEVRLAMKLLLARLVFSGGGHQFADHLIVRLVASETIAQIFLHSVAIHERSIVPRRRPADENGRP